MDTADVVIRVSGLSKRFGGNPVLQGIDLEVRHGETLVILGGSGSGKSTLLRCLVGLEQPDAGRVTIQGVDLFDSDPVTLSRLRERIGMAFQGGALFGSRTVAENVELPLEEFTAMPRLTRRIVARIKLGMVGLEDAMDLYPAELSGGMVKRAALARALALDPDVLLFDEPSAGLDPVTAAELDRLMIQLKRAFGVTTVVVTHELHSAFAIADRIALIDRGRFRIVDTPSVVRACDDPLVRRFLDREPAPSEDSGKKFRRFLDDLR
ncbi:MAG TPA: ATP-binding cassette domain-containing protein [Candidatus Polarisedimenticolaceae bacterium]|nr:ATP-binding cassette domain-containing protein [Candidatus Polarisedimenticolaceae bacterium]